MLDIVYLIVLVILLGTGVGVILVAFNFSKTFRFDYLQSYIYYLVLYYVYGLYGLIGTFLARLMLQNLQSPAPVIEAFGYYIPFLGVPFIMASWYMFIKFCHELVGKKPSSSFTIAYFLFQVIFFFVYGFIVLKLSRHEVEKYQQVTFLILVSFAVIEAITLIMALSQIYFFNDKIKDNFRRKAMINFAHINLAVHIATITLSLLSTGNTIIAGIYLFVYFTGNIPPLLNLGMYLYKYDKMQKPSASVEGINLHDLVIRYGISKRESELIELISQGKTNKEISETLFITLQTVKDHIHHIFQKTGVRNRVELMNIIRESNRKDT
jgi:DNA-binding CsgD family transcriptional regulator